MISTAIGFRIEGVELEESQAPSVPKEEDVYSNYQILDGRYHVINTNIPHLMLGVMDVSDNDYLFYKNFFIPKSDHLNFLSKDSEIGPIAASIYYDKDKDSFVALLRTSEGNRRAFIPLDQVPKSWWRKWVNLGPATWEILKSVSARLPVDKLYLVNDQSLPKALLNMEEKQIIKGLKFGILYSKEGQTKEDEMFSNVDSSPEFEEFLEFLGERVQLENFASFRGGLDVKTRTTGTHSIFTKFNGTEVMFHVSTMLPYNPLDKQQLERKRHIGNDIVIIIFQEGDTIYKPTAISSRQVHVVFVVKPLTIQGQRYYKLAVVSKDGVPEFGPKLPVDNEAIYKKDEDFRKFLYVKLFNAEKACYTAPIISNKLTRTRNAMLKDIANDFL